MVFLRTEIFPKATFCCETRENLNSSEPIVISLKSTYVGKPT